MAKKGKKNQSKWKSMSTKEINNTVGEARKRLKPGAVGGKDFIRIAVRPQEEFISFRYDDVDDKGYVQRLAGKRLGGSWDTHAWLINHHNKFGKS